MKKVLYFQFISEIDGSGKCLLKTVALLQGTGVEPVIAFREPGPLSDELEAMGVRVVYERRQQFFGNCTPFNWPPWHRSYYTAFLRFPVAVWSAWRVVRRESPDLVHVNSLLLVAAAVGAHLAGVPAVLHVREHVLRGTIGFRRLLVRLLVKTCVDRVIAISEAERIAAGFPGGKTVVIPDWVDWDERAVSEPARVRALHGVSPGAKIVLFVGGERPLKGAHVVYEAISMIPHDLDCVLLVLGYDARVRTTAERRYVQELDDLKRRSGQRILRIGVVSDPAEYFAACDILVFPSTAPHFADPVIEAAWFGKPSVMSDDELGREQIEDGATGLLARPGDARDLAQKMARLLTEDALREQMGRRARERMLARHTSAGKKEQLLAVYRAAADWGDERI
ncbi:MAG: glycosyltransferase family 4 protein [Kiritimatiellae bacterium]|nr:glycosyltransferase family 4 protein [Kiritimatiellia bacterium]